MSPEIVSKREYCGKQCDIWALGILLFNMVYGRCPFRGENERDLYRRIAKGVFAFPEDVISSHPKTEDLKGLYISSSLKSLISRILVLNPAKRLTCSEILGDRWFKE